VDREHRGERRGRVGTRVDGREEAAEGRREKTEEMDWRAIVQMQPYHQLSRLPGVSCCVVCRWGCERLLLCVAGVGWGIAMRGVLRVPLCVCG
jgi:hypothetical protein